MPIPNTFPIEETTMIGLSLEWVFYGIFLVTFFLCLRALVWDLGFERRTNIHWGLLAVAVALCIFATLDVALGLLHNIQAFVLYTGPGGAVEEFSDISNWISFSKSVSIFSCVCIGDAVLIYRCWIVYGKDYCVIILPTLLWMADTACACVLTWIEATLDKHSLLQNSRVRTFLLPFTSITIVQNILTTSLIVHRIWRVDKESAEFRYHIDISAPRRSKLQNVIRIAIESGLLYTAFAVMSFIAYATKSDSFYVTCTDLEIPIIGIAFNLLIVRANKQWTYS